MYYTSYAGAVDLVKDLEETFSLTAPNGCLCVSADDYYSDYGDDGELIGYHWSPDKVQAAHEWCRGMVDEGMASGISIIIVHNTNGSLWEMKPYLEMAEDYGYEVRSLVVENRRGSVNVHGVPNEILARQENKIRGNLKLI